ncbi:outer membrane protein [Paracoccus aminovorans]|uniref:outer membrane protein n=1 Tax=Paracoccus aminovorans TaxID=34004 RepID=UPI002B258E3C|nr:outer membrane protein [Paracoccus aminovorans]
MRATRLIAPFATLALGAAAANAGGYTPPVVDTGVVAPITEVAPVGNWQGGYAGLTLGYAFGGDDDVGVSGVTPDSLEMSGANGGVRLGYRWQKDRWVFGPELGYEGGNIKDSFSTDGYDAESKVKNVLALRMKTGYEVAPNTLVYGIAGVARGKIDYSVTGNGADINDTYTKTGYIVGLGAERMINDKWSVTGEYEYANFGKEKLSDGTNTTNATPKFHNIKLGVNFKF